MTRAPSAPIIIKLGGLAVESPERAEPLFRAAIEAHRANNAGLILVHGGGKAVDDHLARLGIETIRREGLRVTGDAEINEVVAVLAGKVNKSIVGALQSLDPSLSAVGLCLGDGQLTHAIPHKPGGNDLGHVGEIVSGNPNLLSILLRERILPVISPIAFAADGHPLNVNGDDAAAAVASIIGARLLILLTDVPGVLDASKKLIPSLTSAEAERLIQSGTISGGMIPKVRAALQTAGRSGVPTIIASWNDPAAITALARGQAAGTRFEPAAITNAPQHKGDQ